MMREIFTRPGKWWPILIVPSVLAFSAALVTGLTATSAAQDTNANPVGPLGAVSNATHVGHIGPGRLVYPQVSETPFVPTSEQLAARERAMAGLQKHRAPSFGRHTTASNVALSGGPQTETTVRQAPNDFSVFFALSLINSKCAACGQSSINEPSSANSGRVVVETSNWNIGYTLHANQTPIPWLNQSPYAFSSGFCCDQEVIYVPSRDVFLLLQLDYTTEGAASNGLALSVARGTTPTSWCTYKFAGAIGGGATDTPDFPKIAVSNNNVFISWNDYPPNASFARSGLARMPLDSIVACAGFNYGFLTRTTEFNFSMAQAPSTFNQFYWASNWFLDGTTNGQNMRIFYWPDNSGNYFNVTRGINAYTFGTVACGSPDWCSRLDPRYNSVVISPAEYRAQADSNFAGDSILEVATTAGPSGFSNGKNYVVYNYFKLNSLNYIGNDQTYSTTDNFAYPGCAVNDYGSVGCAMAEGTNAPGGLITLQDNVNPVQPWGFRFVAVGVNGASSWGDYIVASPWHPSGGPFQTVLWRVNSSNVVQPFYLVWGRGRDANGYHRWNAF